MRRTPPSPPSGSPTVALVDATHHYSLTVLQNVADAIQTQLVRDLLPAWGVAAWVQAYATSADVPPDAFPVTLVTGPLPGVQAGSDGFHSRLAPGQPFAQVLYNAANWSSVVSHEILEMLVNPCDSDDFDTFRKVRLTLPDADHTVVDALVEIADPTESNNLATSSYTIDGVLVSNFIWPSWYGPDVYAHIPIYGDQNDYENPMYLMVDISAEATEVQPPAEDCDNIPDHPAGRRQGVRLTPTRCINNVVDVDIPAECTALEVTVWGLELAPCATPVVHVTGGPEDVDWIFSATVAGPISISGLKPGTYHIVSECHDATCPDSSFPFDDQDVALADEPVTIAAFTECL